MSQTPEHMAAAMIANLPEITDLSLEQTGIGDAGIELLKLGMTWPMDPELITDFAQCVDRIVVVEEKRAFVETQVSVDKQYGWEIWVPLIQEKGLAPQIANAHDRYPGDSEPDIPGGGVVEFDGRRIAARFLCKLVQPRDALLVT